MILYHNCLRFAISHDMSWLAEGAPALLGENKRERSDDIDDRRDDSGLDFERHGVVWNNYRPGYIVHPTVFSVVAQALALGRDDYYRCIVVHLSLL